MKGTHSLGRGSACAVLALAPLLSAADVYVARTGENTDTPPYASWASAASNIQDAVNAATNNATVWVQAGTYRAPANPTNYPGSSPNVVYLDKPLILRSASGNPADTIIDGGNAHRGLVWYYPSASSASFVLDGFTVCNGLANQRGGGILLDGSGWTSTIRNCILRDNLVTNVTTQTMGGGGLSKYSTVVCVLSNCTFRDNMATNTASADGGGGGVFLASGSISTSGTTQGRIDNCLFEGNSAYNTSGGGLLFNAFGKYEIRNSVIRGNTQWQSVGNATRGGGGLEHMYGAQLYLWNCLIADNQANGSGSAIYNMKNGVDPAGNTLVLRNCTVAGNSGPSAAVQTRQATDHLVMYNSILYGNTARDLSLGSTNTFSYLHHSCFPTNPSPGTCVVFGAGNLTSDPGFLDASGGNYRLGRNSPCLNAGTNQPDWMAGALDLDGHSRIDNLYRTVDMGCYETVYRGSLITIR